MKKNILIVSDTPTHPTTAGNRQAILAYCDLLARNGYNVFFLFIISPFENKENTKRMREYWKDNLFVFRVSMLQFFLQRINFIIARGLTKNFCSLDIFCPWFVSGRVKKIVKRYNIESLIVNYIWLTKIFSHIRVKNSIIYTHDVFSHKYMKGNSKWFSFSPAKESKALQRCNKILAIQENEAVYFQYLSPLSIVYTVFSPFYFHYQKIVRDNYDFLFFSGENSHNQNGIRAFVKNIFPVIKSKYPHIKVKIGGGICSYLDEYENEESICLMGKFDDPSDFYALGNIVINPVYEGTGLKIKTFEAISYGKVVLAHPHSFEGVYDPINIPMYKCAMAEDYLRCLDEICSGNLKFEDIQRKCSAYIERMTDSILTQYNKALS